MNAVIPVLIATLLSLTLSLALSLAVLRVLSAPLHQLLEHLCPDAAAAAFWLSYTRVMLLIAPLLLVLIIDLSARFQDPLDTVRLTLIASLAGLLIALRAIGKRLGAFVRTPDGGEPA